MCGREANSAAAGKAMNPGCYFAELSQLFFLRALKLNLLKSCETDWPLQLVCTSRSLYISRSILSFKCSLYFQTKAQQHSKKTGSVRHKNTHMNTYIQLSLFCQSSWAYGGKEEKENEEERAYHIKSIKMNQISIKSASTRKAFALQT